jgi:DnaD/phage-associated family protein
MDCQQSKLAQRSGLIPMTWIDGLKKGGNEFVARPRKEGMDYFPHDTDAANDEKIEALRSLFGNDGYAFYFILLERIYRTNEAELDISKPILLAPIASKIGVGKEVFAEMLEASFEVGLFDKEEYEKRKVITSSGIKSRFSEVNSMRKRWRKSKENDGNKEVFHGENSAENGVENEFSTEKTGEETPESKVKQSKANEKEKELKETATAASQNSFTFYQNNFGSLSPYIADKIDMWENDTEQAVVIEAMKIATERNKRTWSFVEGILKDWVRQGAITIDSVKAVQAEFSRQKGAQQSGGQRKENSGRGRDDLIRESAKLEW